MNLPFALNEIPHPVGRVANHAVDDHAAVVLADTETPLGQGQLDIPAYLAALEEAGYRNIPFLRRSQSDRPLEEVADAKRRLDELLS